MTRLRFILPVAIALASAALSAVAQRSVPVPGSCTPQVNQKLAGLLNSDQHRDVDNVMVCGITVSSSRTQYGGPHGNHEILPLRVTMPGGDVRLVEVVINDDLDGRVTAPAHVSVFAYGQAFFPSRGRFVAGIHDVHCSTHRGADNGWVVVNGAQHPVHCQR
ncbi:MAG: hypothetical protein WA634_14810 [Silvibacterium sp.]